ncbi:hypothetical protein P3G55_17025 [Leptospira sp. 96542]|nr:hypothetical protein [Leptospira sp. 96542]
MKKLYSILIYFCLAFIVIANPSEKREFKAPGFSMEAPAEWDDITVEEFKDNIKRVDLGSPSFNKFLHENNEIPLFSIRKGDPELEEYLATINVKVQVSDLKFNNIPADLRTYLYRISLVLKNFDYLIEPKTIRINGNLAGYSLFSYTLIDENKNERKVASAFWIFPRKNHIYLIGSGFVYENFEPTLKEIKQIVGTIKITDR